MKKKISMMIMLAMLFVLCGCSSKSPVIGAWKTDSSVIGYAVESEAPYEISVNFDYENHANESHYPNVGNRTVDFYYSEDGSALTVWQGTDMIVYNYTIQRQGGEEVMELIADDGSTVYLTRVSDRPLGIQ